MPLIGNVPIALANSILKPLGLTTAASATDAAIHKEMFGSYTTTLTISNEEMNYIMKINKYLEESGLLIKDFTETIKNEAKEQKGRFIEMLLGTLGASLLGNLLTGKRAIAMSRGRERLETLATPANMSGRGTIRGGKGTIRAAQDF